MVKKGRGQDRDELMHVAMVMTFELQQSTGTCPNILSRRLYGLL